VKVEVPEPTWSQPESLGAHIDPAEAMSRLQRWEQAAAQRLVSASNYTERRRIYREIYSRDNEFWLEKIGRYGMSGQCSRNHQLLKQAFPGHGPLLDVGGGLGVAGEAFDPSRLYAVCDAAPVSYGGARSRHVVAGYATDLPFPDQSFEAVLILDVLEHLHREDLDRAVREARRVLRPRGRLLMATPNRLSGPWDCRSAVDGSNATVGLHLNELTVAEMIVLAKQNGMVPIAFAVKEKRALWFQRPIGAWAALCERITEIAPRRLRNRLCRQAILLAEVPGQRYASSVDDPQVA
jgi:SAM-dependent methyltransferase